MRYLSKCTRRQGRCFVEAIHVCNTEVLIEKSEHYLQINDINPSLIKDIWEALADEYPGFELWLCFHNNTPPEDVIRTIGAEILDDCVDLRLLSNDFNADNIHRNVSRLELDDFEGFAAMYDKLPDMNWTSRRIRETWNIWCIFVMRGCKKIIGYTLMMISENHEYGEIFALEALSTNQKKALLAAACAEAFEIGKNSVIYMADTLDQQELAKGLGFHVSGYYKGYRVIL